MKPDELISGAMRAGGGMLDGKPLFAVEGHVERNDLRVRNLETVYADNYHAFRWGVKHNFILMGIFNSEEAAEEYIVLLRTLARDESGNRIE